MEDKSAAAVVGSVPADTAALTTHSSASDGLSELDWIELLNPRNFTRNGQHPFCWSAALKSFLVHLMHPFGSPLVYLYIRARHGKSIADVWVHNHINFKYPSFSRPIFTRKKILLNSFLLSKYIFYTFVIHAVAVLPMIFAFARMNPLPWKDFKNSVSQDYTHEAYFGFFFRIAWCAVVAIKYGFYSHSLRKHMNTHAVPLSYLESEHIFNNWCPDLGRLMFELLVATSHFPSVRSISLSIPKKHPVCVYLLQCKKVNDNPLCLLKPAVISEILQELPERNFHKVFWTRTPPVIQSMAFTGTEVVDVESYSKYLQKTTFATIWSAGSDERASSTPANSHELFVIASSHSCASAHTTASGNSAACSTPATSVSTGLLSSLFLPSCQFKPDSDEDSSMHYDVPAVILLAYSISRAYCEGSAWIRPSKASCRIQLCIRAICFTFYVLPGAMRVAQVDVL
jgi:hypothetical protein